LSRTVQESPEADDSVDSADLAYERARTAFAVQSIRPGMQVPDLTSHSDICDKASRRLGFLEIDRQYRHNIVPKYWQILFAQVCAYWD
jgi:hypothetical protein